MPSRCFHFLSILLLALFLTPARGDEPKITVIPDKATGVYAPNEKVTWTVDVTGDRSGLTALPYTVKLDAANVVTSGTLDLSSGPATISATRAEPGALLAEIKSMDKTKQLPVAMGGAVFSPEKIAAAQPAPSDFDQFWQEKLKELAAVPAQPKLEPISVDGIKSGDGMELYRLTMDNIRGTHVQAILARPAKEKKYPALIIYNSAGVGPLDKAAILGYAKSGWLVINVSAHDLPVDETPEFYNKLKAGELKNYYSIGSEDRETSYFLRMFLGDVRAVEYVTTRPDWDGKTLLITGVSQGGLQCFATAGLCPKVTGVMIDVPAGCDVYGPLANPPRGVSWPYWLSKFNPGKDLKKVQATAGYYDSIYFAPRIQCPTLVAVALLDIAARPAGVIAAYNALTAQKQLVIMPLSDHYGSGGTQSEFFYRFARLRESIQKGNEWSLPLP